MSGMVIWQKYSFKIQIGQFFGLRKNLRSCYLFSKNKRGELYFKTDHQCWLKGMGRNEKSSEEQQYHD